jgi:hypothetical protein
MADFGQARTKKKEAGKDSWGFGAPFSLHELPEYGKQNKHHGARAPSGSP